MPEMGVRVETIPYEELPAYIRIIQRAFQTGVGAVLLDGRPSPTPADAAKHLSSAQKDYQNPINRYCKAVDTTTGEMIAVAKWQFFLVEQTLDQLNKTLKIAGPGDEDYNALHAPVINYIKGSRREFMDIQPYIYLSILTTDPDHHRKGAGRALVEWGTKQADELGIPTYLEASIEGHPLYERCGFQVVREARFNMHKLGRSDIPAADVNRVMIRPTKVKDGIIGQVDWKVGHEYHWQPKYA